MENTDNLGSAHTSAMKVDEVWKREKVERQRNSPLEEKRGLVW